MIQLTRLNKDAFVVNSDLIKMIECRPDTIITLVNGDKLLVLEKVETIIERVSTYKRAIAGG